MDQKLKNRVDAPIHEFLETIVLTDHGYWCRRKDLMNGAKEILDSGFTDFPNPSPEWMINKAKEQGGNRAVEDYLKEID